MGESKFILGALFTFLLLLAGCSEEQNLTKQGVLTVSGEEDGECLVAEINMWSTTKSLAEGAEVVGKIPDACPQNQVDYYAAMESNGRIWYLVTHGETSGWITDSFVVSAS